MSKVFNKLKIYFNRFPNKILLTLKTFSRRAFFKDFSVGEKEKWRSIPTLFVVLSSLDLIFCNFQHDCCSFSDKKGLLLRGQGGEGSKSFSLGGDRGWGSKIGAGGGLWAPYVKKGPVWSRFFHQFKTNYSFMGYNLCTSNGISKKMKSIIF